MDWFRLVDAPAMKFTMRTAVFCHACSARREIIGPDREFYVTAQKSPTMPDFNAFGSALEMSSNILWTDDR